MLREDVAPFSIESDCAGLSGHTARIVEALRRMGPAAIAEIARAVGITNGAAHRSCYRLYVQGVLVRIGNAHGPTRYRLREERQEGANVLPEEGDKGKKRVVK